VQGNIEPRWRRFVIGAKDKSTDCNQAEERITTEQSTRHRLQIGASNCELGEAKSAPATASSAKPNPRQRNRTSTFESSPQANPRQRIKGFNRDRGNIGCKFFNGIYCSADLQDLQDCKTARLLFFGLISIHLSILNKKAWHGLQELMCF